MNKVFLLVLWKLLVIKLSCFFFFSVLLWSLLSNLSPFAGLEPVCLLRFTQKEPRVLFSLFLCLLSYGPHMPQGSTGGSIRACFMGALRWCMS